MSETIHPLVRALEQYDNLSAAEVACLEGLSLRIRDYAKEDEIVSRGDRPTQSCLLLDGYAARALIFEDGRRQITNLHVPGDFVDLHSLLLKRMDHNVIAFSACKVAFVAHNELRNLIDRHPHLGRLLWLTTLVDAAIDCAWIACLGRRSAPDHLAHFLCELYCRLRARGLSDDFSFRFTATQAEFADVLGMSVVHVNRTIQDLRKLGLIEWQGGTVIITDFAQLAARAAFDEGYLNQWVEPR